MSRLPRFLPILVPALALLFLADRRPGSPPEAQAEGSRTSAGSKERKQLPCTGRATIKGKVTYDGEPPAVADFGDSMAGNKDKDYCLKGDTEDPTWVVGPDKGVAQVVVWLRPLPGAYFPITDARKKWTDVVALDQPICQFKPHVAVLFPSYWDPATGDQKPTGQVFKVRNSAKVGHNVIWAGNPILNPGDNFFMPAREGSKVAERVLHVRTGRLGKEDMVTVRCNLHLWMFARVWSFEHPYATVTGKDGTYEIRHVPAGAELYLVGWHEDATPNWLLPEGAGRREGLKLEPLQDGEVREINFTVKK
jgi:hypothetical protein